jgi:hypothetical protein
MQRTRLGKLLMGAIAVGAFVLMAWGQQKPTPTDVGDLDQEKVKRHRTNT